MDAYCGPLSKLHPPRYALPVVLIAAVLDEVLTNIMKSQHARRIRVCRDKILLRLLYTLLFHNLSPFNDR